MNNIESDNTINAIDFGIKMIGKRSQFWQQISIKIK